MKSDSYYLETAKRYAAVEFNDFIEQEVYKTAIELYRPDEFQIMKGLKQKLDKTLERFQAEFDFEEKFEWFKDDLYNVLLFGSDPSQVNDKHMSKNERDFSAELIDVTTKLPDLFVESPRINHSYPPSVLFTEYSLMDALLYWVKKLYEPQFSGTDENKTICTVHPPFGAMHPYRKIPISFEHSTTTHPVPSSSISQRIYNDEVEVTLDIPEYNETVARAFLVLENYDGEQELDKFDSLKINIDLSSPLTQQDYLLLLSKIESQISRIQTHNAEVDIMLAKHSSELIRAASVPYLQASSDWLEFVESQSPERKVKSPKQYLIGLIAFRAYHLHTMPTPVKNALAEYCLDLNKKRYSQDDLFNELSAYLSDAEGIKGAGTESISNNYKLVNALVQNLQSSLEI
ncbi:hypothetical protein ACNO5E_21315 [Vibrio parahaemolyticus]|uniref:hypothetical protein n=1 Tax=Vibrio parahaemolyticus TaxID=670 RepID=UPI000813BD4E|nr:hypothetical protein [Vibrio parahaemolyticus]OCP68372.1 hypothetical protein AKH08_16290 [Vibrio parahaemolyticus]